MKVLYTGDMSVTGQVYELEDSILNYDMLIFRMNGKESGSSPAHTRHDTMLLTRNIIIGGEVDRMSLYCCEIPSGVVNNNYSAVLKFVFPTNSSIKIVYSNITSFTSATIEEITGIKF